MRRSDWLDTKYLPNLPSETWNQQPGVLDVHTSHLGDKSIVGNVHHVLPHAFRLVEELKALSTHADQELSDGQDTKDPILGWIPLNFSKAWEKSDVYKVKYTPGKEETYPTQTAKPENHRLKSDWLDGIC